MNNKYYIILSAALMTMSCSQQNQGEQLSKALDEIFEARYTDSSAPGGAVLIAKGDDILYERYFGTADLGTGEMISDSTLFNIGNASEQFTAIGLLKTGMSLKNPINNFLFFTREFWNYINLEGIATHTTGLIDPRDRRNPNVCFYADENTTLEYFRAIGGLDFAPGTSFEYLNPGYIMLGKVIEKETDQDFGEYQSQQLFQPLGMNSTVYFSPINMPEHTAHAYVLNKDGEWNECDFEETPYFGTRPDHGLFTTTRDLLKWENGLSAGKVLPDSLLQMAYTPHADVANSTWSNYQKRPHTSYGIGWFIDETPGEPLKIYQIGRNGGFQSYIAKYPQKDIRIIWLENRNDEENWETARKIDKAIQETYNL